MSKVAAIRTVRRLDERSETKEVCGVVIERDVPLPKRSPPGKLDSILNAMEVGESFVHHNRAFIRTKQAGRVFTMRKIGGGKYRIWRTA